MKKNKLFLSAIAALSVLAISCSKDDDNDSTPILVANTVSVKNLAADTGSTGHFTFFRLSDSSVVALSDSNSTKWDIGFRTTSIIVNSRTSGPGTASAQLVSGGFADITTAPAAGYLQDSTGGRAVATWYTYDPTSHIISPTAGKTIVVKTNDNKYAKITITSYYKNSPATPDAFADVARMYTFKYTIQQNGTASFQ